MDRDRTHQIDKKVEGVARWNGENDDDTHCRVFGMSVSCWSESVMNSRRPRPASEAVAGHLEAQNELNGRMPSLPSA